VASSCGVCILDISKYKWKQFGTPTEERTFGIVAMTWWEGNNGGDGEDSATTATASEEETEDLLVAIIQSNNGRQYLFVLLVSQTVRQSGISINTYGLVSRNCLTLTLSSVDWTLPINSWKQAMPNWFRTMRQQQQ
jgi:hypothetical protein